ncbi:MAG: SGNH/GDSL hydrolase family protein [Myxococcales bacterium]|nr:SGNH/GDSL hydrolase family protein [Myxococcales bacterium]
MHANRAALRLALLVVSVLLPFAGFEAGLRIWSPVSFRAPQPRLPGDIWREVLHVRSPIPGLSYELAPRRETFATGVPIATNAQGMRSYELLAKSHHVRRVAVVGDSYTFGFGVPMHQTFVAETERLLNGSDRDARQYEFLNFGVGGYSSRDEALVVEHKVLPLDPDLILIAYSLNDPEVEPLQPVHSYYQDVALWQWSHVLRKLSQARLELDIRRLGGGDYIRYLHRHAHKWRSVEQALGRIAALAGARRVPAALVIFPHSLVMRWDAYPYGPEHAQVARAARAAGLPVLDLLTAFQRAGRPLRLRVGRTDDHPNQRAHALAARHIETWLRNELLGPEESNGSDPHAIAPPFIH